MTGLRGSGLVALGSRKRAGVKAWPPRRPPTFREFGFPDPTSSPGVAPSVAMGGAAAPRSRPRAPSFGVSGAPADPPVSTVPHCRQGGTQGARARSRRKPFRARWCTFQHIGVA
jgi:hypothetical protein